MQQLMKTFMVMFLISSAFTSYGQEVFVGKKGCKAFPGHLHATVTVNKDTLHYQLFNHWYSKSYAQLRDIEIPAVELVNYSLDNDTLSIIILDNKVNIKDKRNKLDKILKDKALCTSIDEMRKIAYAFELSKKYDGIKHYQLFTHETLQLSEQEFKLSVQSALNEIIASLRVDQ